MAKNAVIFCKSLFLAVAVISFCSGCGYVKPTKASSRQLRRQLLNSFVFRASYIFYPKGTTLAPDSLVKVNASGKRYLNKQLIKLCKSVSILNDDDRNNLSKIFGKGFRYDARVIPQIMDMGDTVAATQIINKRKGIVMISTIVLQSIFRAALYEGWRHGLPGQEHPVNKTESEVLADFLAYRDKVERAKVRSMNGDNRAIYFDHDNENEGRTMLLNLYLNSFPITARFKATMMFVLAHETGHVALGHFYVQDTSCSYVLKREREADFYAVRIISSRFDTSAYQNASLMYESGGYNLRTLLGDEAFFDDAYQFSGLKTQGPECPYPEPAIRKDYIDKVYKEISQNPRKNISDLLKQLLIQN